MILFLCIAILCCIDLFTFKELKTLCNHISGKHSRKVIYWLFWSVNVLYILSVIYGYIERPRDMVLKVVSQYYFMIAVGMALYIPKFVFVIFHLIEDLVHLAARFSMKYMRSRDTKVSKAVDTMSRSEFISKVGILTAALPFFSITYGIAKGRFDFKVRNIPVTLLDLPESFEGFRILQISDIHIGSFIGEEHEITKAVNLINSQNADIIFFTGDLVNVLATEADHWVTFLGRMHAKYGKYSVLGNHDYGGYYHWSSEAAQTANLDHLKELQHKMGFRLLLNESFPFYLDHQAIGIIGIENWGMPPFPQKADYLKAVKNVENIPCKILLSHDPTYWDKFVAGKKDIDLTLSGHTHGMQFGVSVGSFQWSPIKYKYPHWAGLYRYHNQYLYVNRGLGYIGFSGRVGIPPEITVITLHRDNRDLFT